MGVYDNGSGKYVNGTLDGKQSHNSKYYFDQILIMGFLMIEENGVRMDN